MYWSADIPEGVWYATVGLTWFESCLGVISPPANVCCGAGAEPALAEAICFLSSMISRSISALRLRFPTRLKLDSILHSSLSRRHLEQSDHGSWTTSHRSCRKSLVRKMFTQQQAIVPLAGLATMSHRTSHCSHLLLSTFITGALHWLPPPILAGIMIIHILNTPWGAVDPRHSDIAFATLHAVGGHGDRRMIETRHYGISGSWSIITPCA